MRMRNLRGPAGREGRLDGAALRALLGREGAAGAGLTDPPFEREAHSLPIRWLLRARWRRRLHRLLREPDAVLEDFGTRRAALARYVRRPPWRR